MILHPSKARLGSDALRDEVAARGVATATLSPEPLRANASGSRSAVPPTGEARPIRPSSRAALREVREDLEALSRLPAHVGQNAKLLAPIRKPLLKALRSETPPLLPRLPDGFREDREVVLAWLGTNPDGFTQLTGPLRRDPEIARRAFDTNPRVYEELPASIRNKKAIALRAVRADGTAYSTLPKRLQDDPDIARAAFEANPRVYSELPKEIRWDREVALRALKAGEGTLATLPKALRRDRDVVLAAVARDGAAYAALEGPLRSDLEVVRSAVTSSRYAYRHLSPEQKADKSLAAAALAKFPEIFFDLTPELQAEPELAALAARMPSLYRGLSATLQAHPEVALESLIADAANFEYLPSSLREDIDLVAAAVRENPELYASLPATVRRRKEVALSAVGAEGELLQYAPKRLRADREVVSAAVSENRGALRFAAPPMRNNAHVLRAAFAADSNSPLPKSTAAARLMRDPRFVLSILRPTLVPDVAPELIADEDFMSSAVAFAPMLMNRAKPPLSRDAGLWLKALAFHEPMQGELGVPASLLRKPDFGRRAVALRPELLLRAHLEGDRAAVRAAVNKDAGVVRVMSDELRHDLAFVAECARANPLVLWSLVVEPNGGGREIRRRLEEKYPDLARARHSLERELEQANIDHLERFKGNHALLREVLSNRASDGANDSRPVALVILSKEDWNGALAESSEMERISQNFRLMYYEVRTDQEAMEAAREGAAARKASLVIIGGHGDAKHMALGADDPAKGFIAEHAEELYIDVGDVRKLAKGLADIVDDGADVVLKSCSNGSGDDRQMNVANAFAQALPQANVYALRLPGNASVQLDPDGRFRSAGLGWAETTSRVTYFVPAHQRDSRWLTAPEASVG